MLFQDLLRDLQVSRCCMVPVHCTHLLITAHYNHIQLSKSQKKGNPVTLHMMKVFCVNRLQLPSHTRVFRDNRTG